MINSRHVKEKSSEQKNNIEKLSLKLWVSSSSIISALESKLKKTALMEVMQKILLVILNPP